MVQPFKQTSALHTKLLSKNDGENTLLGLTLLTDTGYRGDIPTASRPYGDRSHVAEREHVSSKKQRPTCVVHLTRPERRSRSDGPNKAFVAIGGKQYSSMLTPSTGKD